MTRIAGLCALAAAGALLALPAMAQSQNWNQTGVSSGWNGPSGGNGPYQSGYDQGGQWYGRSTGDNFPGAGANGQNFGNGPQEWGGNAGPSRVGEIYDQSNQGGLWYDRGTGGNFQRQNNTGGNGQNFRSRSQDWGGNYGQKRYGENYDQSGRGGQYANHGWNGQNQGNWQNQQGNWQNQSNWQNRYGNTDQYRQGRGGQYGQGWNGQSGARMNAEYGSSRFSGNQDRYGRESQYPNRMGYRSDRNYSSSGQPFGGRADRGD